MNPYNIYEQLPASVWFLTAVFLIICVYLLERVRVKQKIKEDNVESEQQISNDRGIRLIECNMPNCIRCTKNVHILELAKHRLTAFSIPTSVPEKIYAELKNCVSNIMEDLQEALNDKVRSGDASNSNKLSDDTAVALTVSTPTVVFLRGLAEKAFFSETEFLGVDKLVDGFEKIYLEFLHLYQSPLPETKPLWIRNNTDSGSWEISHLVNQGRITKAGELCPLTMQILNQMSSFMNNNLFGNAAFSVVHPQTEIATHCGSTNFRIRSHLGTFYSVRHFTSQ